MSFIRTPHLKKIKKTSKTLSMTKPKRTVVKALAYRHKELFSLDNLADYIAEFTDDGRKVSRQAAWDFWYWLDKKCRPLPKRNK